MKIRKEITVLLAIITAVFIGMILLASQGYSPSQSYAGILKYSLSTSVGRANTINKLTTTDRIFFIYLFPFKTFVDYFTILKST